MPSKNIDKKAVCPFYLADLKRGIRCEGLTDDETNIRDFGTAEKKEQIEESYCCDHTGYHLCPVFCSLMTTKYPDAQ